MKFFYNIFIRSFSAVIACAAPFHRKAEKFYKGRLGWRKHLKKWRDDNPGELVWFHAASLGEFEQGRPLIEKLRQKHSHKIILLTFFSPSGFEVRRDYDKVNGVFYLPVDTAANARDFVALLQPKWAVFIKYEVWPNYFAELKSCQVRLIMISVNFRKDQRFFSGLTKSWWNAVLKNCDTFFTQNERTTALLLQAGHRNVITAGDTRYDRVFEVAGQKHLSSELLEWKGSDQLLIAGSTWPDDDNYLYEVFPQLNGWKILFFPHNLNDSQIDALMQKFDARRWSSRENIPLSGCNVVVVDEVGWLNSAYGLADMAWIGGGFNKGIHNTLEAAAWGIAMCFGPRYEKFDEALQLITVGAARSADSTKHYEVLLTALKDESWRKAAGAAAQGWVAKNIGASAKIMDVFDRN